MCQSKGLPTLALFLHAGHTNPEHPIPINLWRTLIFTGPVKVFGICAWLNLDVLGVSEALVHSFGILVAPWSLSSASVAQMLAAASIKVMDALFGLVAQNDAERSRLELLGRSWLRD